MEPTSPNKVNLPTLVRGLNTSEFWIVLFTIIVAAMSAWMAKLPAETAGVIIGILGAGWPLLRSWLKAKHMDAAAEALDRVPPPSLPPKLVETPSQRALNNQGASGAVTFGGLATALLLSATSVVALACLVGCAHLTPEQRKENWSQTGTFLLQKAKDIAISTVVSAAQSQMDASNKADWADSLAAGLRASATVSDTDVRALIGIWTPDKPHWQDLGAQLASLAQQATSLPPDQRNEILAQALNIAAQEARAAALTPLPQQGGFAK